MARRTGLIAIAAVGGLLLTACGSSTAEDTTPAATGEETRSVVHALGTTEVTGTPERVVVLDSGELDAVTSLGVVPVGTVETEGLLDELAATHDFDAADVEVVGTIAEPDLEAVAALAPDLILTNAIRHADLYDQLSALAPTVMSAELGAVWQENFLLSAEAMGMTEQAEEQLADYDARVEEIAAAWGDPAGTEVAVLRFMGAGRSGPTPAGPSSAACWPTSASAGPRPWTRRRTGSSCPRSRWTRSPPTSSSGHRASARPGRRSRPRCSPAACGRRCPRCRPAPTTRSTTAAGSWAWARPARTWCSTT
ncbi:ABC transporter substrate-binding protein [Klenkia terrae]|uniref:ABC transporter substrate-binding protein n=1 Tax=Klenkia terrae TaxID=1052259 RepID=UPI00360E7A87